jgi:hypothetical protein
MTIPSDNQKISYFSKPNLSYLMHLQIINSFLSLESLNPRPLEPSGIRPAQLDRPHLFCHNYNNSEDYTITIVVPIITMGSNQ